MEKAILITQYEQNEYIQKPYSRVYFGHEFCQKLLPSQRIFKKMLKLVKQKQLEFSFLTPYVTNDGLKKVALLLDILKTYHQPFEIIINDWGVLNLIKEKKIEADLVLGRLLVRQHRDPRIKYLFNNNTSDILVFLRKHYKSLNINTLAYQSFLAHQKITRVEIDNTFHGFSLNLQVNNLTASCYVPYVYITTTRRCLDPYTMTKPFTCAISHCQKECQNYDTVFKPTEMTDIYRKGNTLFYKNSNFSTKDLKSKGITRIVMQPNIPI